jgi:hypothetical protein
MARPSLLNPDRSRKICDLIAAGNYAETAARSAGITDRCYYIWMERGRKEHERLTANPKANPKKTEDIYIQFFRDVEKALGESESRLILQIAAAGRDPKHWTANAWLAERRFPEKWGRPWRPQTANPDTIGAIAKGIEALTSGPTLEGEVQDATVRDVLG